MSKFKTALAFSKNVLTTGALFQTSRKVEIEISKKLTANGDIVVAEFGMGHGNITQEILNRLGPNSKLYSFEVNPEFCEVVRKNITDKRLIIVNKGAEELNTVISEDLDHIVSSIPFTIFSKDLRKQILDISYQKLKSQGTFSQVLYSKVMKKKFEMVFDQMEEKVISKIPPEFVYHWYKK